MFRYWGQPFKLVVNPKQPVFLISGLAMTSKHTDQASIVSQLINDMDSTHDILFSEKSRFGQAGIETNNYKDNLLLYDGEKLLLGAIGRAMVHAKASVDGTNRDHRMFSSRNEATQREHKNYLNPLKISNPREQTSLPKVESSKIEQRSFRETSN